MGLLIIEMRNAYCQNSYIICCGIKDCDFMKKIFKKKNAIVTIGIMGISGLFVGGFSIQAPDNHIANVSQIREMDSSNNDTVVDTVSYKAPVKKPAPKKKAPVKKVVSKGDRIANAAKGQIGRRQDCARAVSNALQAAHINFYNWPKYYKTLGHTVAAKDARPGDLIYYANNGMGGSHIAVYIGNGQAIHGGWNGYTTARFSARLPYASAPQYIRVDKGW